MGTDIARQRKTKRKLDRRCGKLKPPADLVEVEVLPQQPCNLDCLLNGALRVKMGSPWGDFLSARSPSQTGLAVSTIIT
jgi:hypothetical protein